jgi:cardiolipin synthase A/B
MPPTAPPPSRPGLPQPAFIGGNHVGLMCGGQQLFPAMCSAIAAARHDVWFATYIFHDDPAAQAVADALAAAARRGVAVHVVVDGFGSLATLPALRQRLAGSGARLEVFRPLDRWYAWLQPGQLRRLHQKLCSVDDEVGFVGGINVIDDHHDIHHGWAELPRLDFAVELRGPLAAHVQAVARVMWTRAHLGKVWRDEVREVASSAAPVYQARRLLRRLRGPRMPAGDKAALLQPVRAALVVRDNLRQRRAIERSYIDAISAARERIDIAVPYFYPGRAFRRALRRAARRGVAVRLLLQGKFDYRIAAMAAMALYDEMRANRIRVFEYTPAFLHAKVAVVDADWATVGSSNIDPLSLLLNLEANVIVLDGAFAGELRQRFEAALAVSTEVTGPPARSGWRGWLQRGVVAWAAAIYLRVAGVSGRY